MTTISAQQHAADQFGRRVAARLSAAEADLPYEVSERLRAARVRAVASRKVAPSPIVVSRGGAGSLALPEEGGLWTRIASVLPLIALVAGLVTLHGFQADRRASELAEVDAALLTDDLPPAAYTDPGFIQFLQSHPD
ncbi:DUF3619 family protein [Ramlibacter sp.]|uniref:DUF3619 family protein n=1 Tax=Ramlibacter sp. TaxID=1917967 RepID=UPI0035B4CE6F